MNKVQLVLIDDDLNVLAALSRLLRNRMSTPKREVSIETYSDPQLALLGIAERNIDLLLCDYRMPYLDGVSLLERVSRSHPNTARVLLTGSPDLNAVLTAINKASVSRVLLKPWNNDQLIADLNDCLLKREHALEEHRLATAARAKSGQLSARELELRRLEAQWPGITQVEWTADGAAQFGDTGLSPLDPPKLHPKRDQ